MSLLNAFYDAVQFPLMSPSNIMTLVGALVLLDASLRIIASVGKNFRVFVLVRLFPRLFGPDLRAMGSWAVVTGASDGIGKEYALQLATNHRLNIVLISRSIQKLNKVATEIETSAPGIKTKCVAIDFSKELDIYDTIETEINGLDIAILVNNVGDAGRLEDIKFFHETTRNHSFEDTIRINCSAVTFMTQIVLPGMVAKKRGVIVNVSSAAGCNEGVMFGSVYSGTKAYVIRFTRTIALECLGSGVIFQTLTPFIVATKMVGRQTSFDVCDAECCVRSALAAIGIHSITCGCFKHNTLDVLFKPVWYFMPTSFKRLLVMSFSEKIKQGRLANGQQTGGQHSKDN